jgi:hypothetical protein
MVIWALPDTEHPPLRALDVLFFLFFAVMVMWPGYIAIAIPGLPWITLARLTQVPLTILLLVSLSVSAKFRSSLSSILGAAPWLRNIVFAFAALQAVSIFLSAEMGDSINKFLTAQTSWTAIFVTGCFVFAKSGRAERGAVFLCLMAGVIGVLGLVEYRLGHPVWVGHIPSFLQIDDPSVARAIAGQSRPGGEHRVQATYTTSLGFAEYLALTFPFVLNFTTKPYPRALRVAAIVGVPFFISLVAVAQSRVGFVGLVISATAYPLASFALRWWRKSTSLMVASVVYLSPVILACAIASTLFIPTISYRVWGGGQAQLSTQARYDQMHLGIPKILSHPWGYGIGRGAVTLGYYSPGGLLTIDSYWLRLALEYGVVGLALYFCLFGASIAYSTRGAITSGSANRDDSLFVPIGIALFNFVIIKSAFAQEDNQSVAYLLMGMLCALTFRQKAGPIAADHT